MQEFASDWLSEAKAIFFAKFFHAPNGFSTGILVVASRTGNHGNSRINKFVH